MSATRTIPRPRVVGPGRRERGYCTRIEALDRALARAEAELDVSRLIERGTERYVDRVETERARERAALETERQRTCRLALAVGALQRETERLRDEVRRLESRTSAPLLAPPAGPTSLLRRLLRGTAATPRA